jgi:hypothetical protein
LFALGRTCLASPAYCEKHPVRKVPEDLLRHCVNIRFLLDGVYVWEFERRGGLVNMRVEGWAIFDSSPHIVCAPLDGQSVAFLPEFAPRM